LWLFGHWSLVVGPLLVWDVWRRVVSSVRATCLIETILAAFEMDEFIYELKEHSAGLNCGRWDYIFSFIKKFRNHSWAVLPDRTQVVMTTPWMAAYVRLLIQTCHRRGVHAMGGMAAQIPIKDDPKANAVVMDKIKADKLREVKAGHDGTWVAHPGLVKLANDVFDEYMKTPNQISVIADRSKVTAKDLTNLGPAKDRGTISIAGIKANISVGLGYLEAWLRGVGCVPINNLMEDAATAEISRCQIWQWIKHGASTHDGVRITKALISQLLEEEINHLKSALGFQTYAQREYSTAVDIYRKLLLEDKLTEFLTTVAYPHVCSTTSSRSKL